MKGGRWSNVQSSGYPAFNGARVDAGNSFTTFQPEFISGASEVTLSGMPGQRVLLKT